MRAFLAPFAVVLFFVMLAPVAILLSLVTGSGDLAHRVGRVWAQLSLKAAGVKVSVAGHEHIPKGIPVVYACNHASQFDIPILYVALSVQFRFLVKQELFKIPLFGHAMRRTGYIPVDRSGGKSAMRSLQEAASRIREGTSVVVFPEGTRSPDGRLREFKVGGMLVALKAGCPIIPVAISRSHHILPKGDLRIQSGEVHVAIGPVIQTGGPDGPRSKQEVTAETWKRVASLLEEENRPV